MERHPNSGKYVAEHQREIAEHFEHLASQEELEAKTAKLLREREAARHRASTWKQAALVVRATVLPPRDPDFDWIPEDGLVAAPATPRKIQAGD